ncbi:conserved hypothetical protein [Vibrio chagasii]|nr:conserved hypothetical protein [Vibrio chagasii]
MNHVDLFLPKPIPIPELELDALQQTMIQLSNLVPGAAIPGDLKPFTAFLEVTPVALAGGFVNRGMLRRMLDFACQVSTNTNFIPWINLQSVVSHWQPWAEARYTGSAKDEIDSASLSVERATCLLPILAREHVGLSRKKYHTELPPAFSAWCVYSESLGYCVFAIPQESNVAALGVNEGVSLCKLLPVKSVLSGDWHLRDGFVTACGMSVYEMLTDEWLEYEKGD